MSKPWTRADHERTYVAALVQSYNTAAEYVDSALDRPRITFMEREAIHHEAQLEGFALWRGASSRRLRKDMLPAVQS